MVRFGNLNLAEEVYPSIRSGTDGMDVIFCRNVLMYLTPRHQRQVVSALHRCLGEGGYLFVNPAEAKIKQGWTLGVPEWKSLPGGKRERFSAIPMLCATEAGAELTLAFEGTAVGAYVVAGPDAGIAEASVDGGPFARVNVYHAYSKGLHYPRTVMLGAELQPGPHTLTLRMASETQSAGHAMRIMQFVAN